MTSRGVSYYRRRVISLRMRSVNDRAPAEATNEQPTPAGWFRWSAVARNRIFQTIAPESEPHGHRFIRAFDGRNPDDPGTAGILPAMAPAGPADADQPAACLTATIRPVNNRDT